MKASELVVGTVYRVPDGRTGRVVLVRGSTITVRMPSGDVLLFSPGQLSDVKAKK